MPSMCLVYKVDRCIQFKLKCFASSVCLYITILDDLDESSVSGFELP